MAKAATKSSSIFWRRVSCVLGFLIITQWILFLAVLHGQRSNDDSTACAAEPLALQEQQSSAAAALMDSSKSTTSTGVEQEKKNNNNNDEKNPIHFDGIAATVMLHAPKWFHRRYTAMLHNVLANIPSTWGIQIFYNPGWLTKDVLPLHPGLQQLFSENNSNNPRILWTPLPQSMTRQKPKEIMKSTWLWESVVAENVLFFSGNGALCANSKHRLNDFLSYDYVGAPWYRHDGKGGDGSTHSFRHRSAMLQVLQDAPVPGNKNDAPDHQYFIKEMLKAKNHVYKIADRNVTMAFAGGTAADAAPFLLSGTQAHLNWTTREALLGVCPEVKMIFPSMHEPACFGAHPNPEQCKSTICALQEPLPGRGC